MSPNTTPMAPRTMGQTLAPCSCEWSGGAGVGARDDGSGAGAVTVIAAALAPFIQPILHAAPRAKIPTDQRVTLHNVRTL